jgi:hypothetical protein
MRHRRSHRGPGPQLLLALFAAGMVLFNFPLLVAFDRDATVLGLPLLPVALFSIWAILIGLLAWAIERRPPDRRSPPAEARPTQAGTADP